MPPIAYIVTEGETDSRIISELLDEKLRDSVEFRPGFGQSSMISIARSLLVARQTPVVIIADADRIDSRDVRAHRNSIAEPLTLASSKIPHDVLLFVPEAEIIFTSNRDYLQKLLGREITDTEFALAQRHPKEFLNTSHYDSRRLVEAVRNSRSDRETLRRHEVIEELESFLRDIGRGEWGEAELGVMSMSETDLKIYYGQVAALVAKELAIEQVEWMSFTEVVFAIRQKSTQVADELERFLNAYEEWYDYHRSLYRRARQGRLSEDEEKELAELMRIRDDLRQTLRRTLNQETRK